MCMQAHKTQVKLTAGVVVRIIDEEQRGGSDQCEARHGYVDGQWVAQPAHKLTLAQRIEHGEETKNTLKMKPHRVRKPFQVAVGQSIKMVTIF